MINWLIQSQADIPAERATWLCAAELAEYAALPAEPRRRAWLAGRWTAKRLIQATRSEAGQLPLTAIELSPADGRAPQACWPGFPRPWPLSISHSGQHAVAALADDAGAPVGIDLERVEARPAAFAVDYFTPGEVAGLTGDPEDQTEQVTAIWCAKEAALKALGVGLTVDTRVLSIWLDRGRSAHQGWRRFEIDSDESRTPPALARAAQALHGWWRRQGPYALAIVTDTSNNWASGWPVEMQPAANYERLV